MPEIMGKDDFPELKKEFLELYKKLLEAQSELPHPDEWCFLRVLPTLAGNSRFTFGCVSQIIPF